MIYIHHSLFALKVYLKESLNTMQLLFDAHIHLTDSEYSAYLNSIIANFRAMNIIACSVTVDIETTLRSFNLFNSVRDVVKQFVGIHPEAAVRENLEEFLEIYRSNLQYVDGVGEVGLDPAYEKNGSSYERQKEVFNAMLQLAESTNKPISIHSRNSLEDILGILPSYTLEAVLLHWFAGSKRQLAKSMDMGLYVSYGPTLVYSEDKKVLLKHTDRDKFLVETDGPIKYSRCFENLPSNSSSFLVSVIASCARILDLSYEHAVQMLQRNSLTYLDGNNPLQFRAAEYK